MSYQESDGARGGHQGASQPGRGRGSRSDRRPRLEQDRLRSLELAHQTPCNDYIDACPRGYRCQYLHDYESFNMRNQAISTDILIGMSNEMIQNQRTIIGLLNKIANPNVDQEEQEREHRRTARSRSRSQIRKRVSTSQNRSSGRSSPDVTRSSESSQPSQPWYHQSIPSQQIQYRMPHQQETAPQQYTTYYQHGAALPPGFIPQYSAPYYPSPDPQVQTPHTRQS